MNKITHMYAVGDSFAYGQGLKGYVQHSDGAAPFTEELRNTVFSGVMANKLGIENYTNAAMPGSSNNRTQRRVITDLSIMMAQGVNPENIFAMINITHSARIEAFDDKKNVYRQLITNYPPPKEDTALYTYWETYSTYFDNVIENADRYLMQIISMQTFLEKHKINYLMIDSMGEAEKFTNFMKNYRKILSTHINRRTYPIMESFHSWAYAKGFPPTACHHANEDAHAAWADYLLTYIEQEKLLETQ